MLSVWIVYCTCTDKALVDIHHVWHTNKCESLNQFVTKFLHKNMHLCHTIVGKAQTYLAIGINSLGYKDYYHTLFYILGLNYKDDGMLLIHHQCLDNETTCHATWANQPEVS
jgi:hypothetical protein